MGFLDDFGMNFDDVKEAGFDVPDGFYTFVTSGGRIQDGTSTDPDAVKFVIDYNLFDENDEAVGQTGEWFTIAERDENGEPVVTPKAKQSLGYLKTALINLGFKGGDLNGVDLDDLEGIRGTLQLKTTPGKKGGAFQNVRNVKLATPEAAKAAPARRAPATQPTTAKKNPFAKPAS